MYDKPEDLSFETLSSLYEEIQMEGDGTQQVELLGDIQNAGIMPVIDPEKAFLEISKTVEKVRSLEGLARVILVGGSTSTEGETAAVVGALRESLETRNSYLKLVGFPGRSNQVVEGLHGILFLYPPQLLNVFKTNSATATFLINEAMKIRKYQENYYIPAISTTYILLGTGKPTSVVEQTKINPTEIHNGFDIENVSQRITKLINKGLVFLESGSGSEFVNTGPIAQFVREKTGILPIVSGGISLPSHISQITNYGAFPLGLGSLLERTEPELVREVYMRMKLGYNFGGPDGT
ncbi:hypothetical protein HYV12_01380 [Candidatus Dojkabacteria bacterium]|nr:hypothetical protein [Candidatus Dojkabacteria bacterium]